MAPRKIDKGKTLYNSNYKKLVVQWLFEHLRIASSSVLRLRSGQVLASTSSAQVEIANFTNPETLFVTL